MIQMPSIKTNQGEIISSWEDGDQVQNIKEEDPMELDDDIKPEDSELWISKQIGRLVTLANLPTSRWQNLLNLDVIKARNKPKNPVVKHESAPFFLPSVSNVLPSENTSKSKVDIKFNL